MSVKGEVVWFERRGSIRLGAVTGGAERKPLVTEADGSSHKVPRARCLHTLEARLDGSLGDLLRRLADQSDGSPEPLELWACMEDGTAYTLADLARQSLGGATDGQVAAVVTALSDPESGRLAPWFRLGAGTLRRIEPAAKERLVERIARRAADAELHERFLAWYTPWRSEGPALPPPDEALASILDELKNHALSGGGNTPKGIKRLAATLERSDPDALLRELASNGALPPHVNELPHRKGIPRRFSPEALEAAAALAELEPTGEDLRHLPTVAIDDADAHEIDDALSVWEEDGTTYLAVHIARIADALPPDGPLEREARKRATSIYFPQRAWPMLPLEVGERFSLSVGETRPALSLICPLDDDGLPGPGRFTPSLIQVDEQAIYGQTTDGLAGDLVRRLRPVVEALRERRCAEGAPRVVLRPLRLQVGDDDVPRVRLAEVGGPSYLVVSELMVLYNARLADALAAAKRAALFRSQPTPLEPTTADPDDPLFPLLVRKTMLPTRVGVRPGPHRSMGLAAYTQATSPIRRLGDLLVQRQFLALLAGDPPIYDRATLEALRLELHPKERRARGLEEERRRYWLCVWLAAREGPLACAISKVGSRPMAYVPELDREFPFARSERTQGDVIQARVLEVDPRARTALLGPWDDEGQG